MSKTISSMNGGTCLCRTCEGDEVIVTEDFVGDCETYVASRGETYSYNLEMQGCSTCGSEENTYLWPKDSCNNILRLLYGGMTVSSDNALTCPSSSNKTSRSVVFSLAALASALLVLSP